LEGEAPHNSLEGARRRVQPSPHISRVRGSGERREALPPEMCVFLFGGEGGSPKKKNDNNHDLSETIRKKSGGTIRSVRNNPTDHA